MDLVFLGQKDIELISRKQNIKNTLMKEEKHGHL